MAIIQKEANRILKKNDTSLIKAAAILQKEMDEMNNNNSEADTLISLIITLMEKENMPKERIDEIRKIKNEMKGGLYDPNIDQAGLEIQGYKITTNISECIDTGIPCTTKEEDESLPNWHCIDNTWHICNGDP